MLEGSVRGRGSPGKFEIQRKNLRERNVPRVGPLELELKLW